MINNIKNILKVIIPQKLIRFISNKFQYNSFKGNFKNFDEINYYTTNYDSNKIIKKVHNAFEISNRNTNLIDRDGEILKTKNQNFEMLTEIINFLDKSKKNCVIDYGGSLANFIRNNINYLGKYNLVWIVIDNKKICLLGKKIIKNNNIYFFEDLDNANKFILAKDLKVKFCLFGSSIQYIRNFEKILKNLSFLKVQNIIVERQPVLKSKDTKYAIQKVPFWVGGYSYAVKLYNSQKLVNLFMKYNFFLNKKINSFGNQFKDGEYKSYIFKKR